MCGIAGSIDFKRATTREELANLAGEMGETLAHRGPDDHGIWVDESAGVALAHRRLSILDLSALGHQPMASASGRYVVTYNGEVYNYAELRDILTKQGHSFRGSSDTEVILAAIERWGFERALTHFNGMFAMAVWDRTERCLLLARDRFGEKPLYYGVVGSSVVFASELKAIRRHPSFEAQVDRTALTLLVRHCYIPAPWSIYCDVRKLPAATWTRIASLSDTLKAPASYWSRDHGSYQEAVEHAAAHPFTGDDDSAVSEVERLLQASVRLRMVSDVPIGAFLSGGVDSSLTVALMQRQSTGPVRTFTIGFTEEGYDEAQGAKAVAMHLGTEHTELYVTPDEARAVVPLLPRLYDEPFADPSQVPTFLVSQLARRSVTVSLSGDGGDEYFAGYTRYAWARSLFRGVGQIPPSARLVLANALRVSSRSRASSLLRFAANVASRGASHRNPNDTLEKLAGVVCARTPDELYLRLVSAWREPQHLVLGGHEPLNNPILLSVATVSLPTFTERMMYADSVTNLPDGILTKVDRASMAVSLESRTPFLDPHLAEFAWSLPMSLKARGKTTKWPLRQVLGRYVPVKLQEPGKRGFSIPFDAWLRGPLREWAEAELSETRLEAEGFFEPKLVRQKWSEHLAGHRNWQYQLWPVLMFQGWLASLS